MFFVPLVLLVLLVAISSTITLFPITDPQSSSPPRWPSTFDISFHGTCRPASSAALSGLRLRRSLPRIHLDGWLSTSAFICQLFLFTLAL